MFQWHSNKINNATWNEIYFKVFCEYRESVNLVHCLLLQCRPLIKPHMFVGQGLGSTGNKENKIKAFSQKQQLRVMQSFREGTCNVLVSTCVGEEGLDVGSVDLIICFDISNKSPVRLVQRCGRTGRERGGRVVILVTEGREHQTLKECMYQRDNLNKRILQSKEIQNNLYSASPRLLPTNVKPECQKMFITVEKIEKNDTEKQSKIKDTFKKKSKTMDKIASYITKEEFNMTFGNVMPISDYLPDTKIWSFSQNDSDDTDVFEEPRNKNKINLSKWLEWQRNLQYTEYIGHSIDSIMLSELLQYADSIRFNLPLPDFPNDIVPPVEIPKQIPSKIPAIKTKDKVRNKQDVKGKNIDIRDMFGKIKTAMNKEESKFKSKLNEILNNCGVENTDTKNINAILERENISIDLVNLMVEMSINEESHGIASDKINDSFMDNLDEILQKIDSRVPDLNDINMNNLPDISLLSLLDFDIIDPKSDRIYQKRSSVNVEILNNITEAVYCDASQDNCSFESRFSIHDDFFAMENNKNKNTESNTNYEAMESNKNTNYDAIDIEGIFNDSFSADHSCERITEDQAKASETRDESKNQLDFFGLGSLDDIFADDSFDDQLKNISGGNRVTNQKCSQINNNKTIEDLATQRLNPIKTNIELHKNVKVSEDNNLSSFLSVSQIIAIVNDPDMKSDNAEPSQINLVSQESQSDADTKIITLDELLNIESDESSHSIILCSQRSKTNLIKKPTSSKKHHVIIPASSDSSEGFDNIEIENLMNLYDNKNNYDTISDKNPSNSVNKRRLSPECSPYFVKSPKLDNQPLKNNKIDEINTLSTINSKKNPSYDKIFKENLRPNNTPSISNKIKNNGNKLTDISQLKLFERDSRSQKLPPEKIASKSSESIHIFSSDEGDDDFIQKPFTKDRSFSISPVKNVKPRTKKNKKNKKPMCEFIDYEAILSEDSYVDTGDDCGNDSDTTMGSFICDEHNSGDDSADINAKYLESVKSPVRIAGAFKIPQLPVRDINVFSQVDPEQDTSYELDSFCVGADEGLTQRHDLSELEIAEAILKNRKRRRKPKSQIKIVDNNKKNKESDSDDSPIMQNKRKRIRRRIDSESETDDDDMQAFQ